MTISIGTDDTRTSFFFDSHSVSDITRETVARALEWVRSLDRSALGDVAVSDELLAITYAKRLMEESLTDSHSAEEKVRLRREIATEETAAVHGTTEFRDFILSPNPCMQKNPSLRIQGEAELLLWLRMDGNDYASSYHPSYVRENAEIDVTIDYLEHIIENPDAKRYYVAGLRGTALVRYCISEDIDVELALTLGRSAAA